jgi:hypothetical protein
MRNSTLPPAAIAKPRIRLSDEELVHVLQAAAPLDRDRRGEFLAAVAAELVRYADPGPGDVDRAIRATQRRFFDPPLDRQVIGGSRGGARKTLGAAAADPLD